MTLQVRRNIVENEDYKKNIIAAFVAAGFEVEPQDIEGVFSVQSDDKPNRAGIQAGLVISPSSCNLVSGSVAISFDSASVSTRSVSTSLESVALFNGGKFVGQLFI